MIYVSTKRETVPVLKFNSRQDVSENEVIEEVNAKTALFNQKFNTSFQPPKVIFGVFGRRYGFYKLGSSEIYIHRDLLKIHDTAFQVATHELSHYLAYRYYGNRIQPHGKEWKFMMKFFQSHSNRTSHKVIAGKMSGFQQKYVMVCPECGKIHMGTKRILETLHWRVCNHCGSSMKNLTYTPIIIK